MEKNKFGQTIYPMTSEEKLIYNRLKEKYKDDRAALRLIEAELLDPTEKRNWEEREGILEMYY